MHWWRCSTTSLHNPLYTFCILLTDRTECYIVCVEDFDGCIYIASFPGSSAPKREHWSCVHVGGESLVFFSCEQHLWYIGGRETLIVHGRTRRLRTGKEWKHWETYYTYLVIGVWISYTPSVEREVCWITHKMLPFCSDLKLFWLHHDHVRKDTRLSTRVHFVFRGSWERG